MDIPTPEDHAKRHYQGEAGRRYHQAKRSLPEAAYPWIAHLRAEKIGPHIRPADTVLEYGVGLGWNLAGLSCRRKLGFDLGQFADLAHQGIEFVPDINAIPARSVDVLICHHTLEHVWQPTTALLTMHRLLRPEGLLLLFVPYEKERRYRSFSLREPNHHLYSWNVQTLGNLVTETGFRIELAGLGRFGQERFAAQGAARYGLGEIGFRTLRWIANTLKGEREVRIVARPNKPSPQPGAV